MLSPHWAVTLITVCSLFPWFGLAIMSPMMFGAPGATDSTKNVLIVLLLLHYPCIIFSFYWWMGWTFLSFKISVFFWYSFGFIVLLCTMFGYYQLLFETFSSIKSSGYSVSNESVYFDKQLINNVDAKSFILLDTELYEGMHYRINYAKDKDHVFYKGSIIPLADSASFKRYQRSDNHFSYLHIDKKHVFYSGHIIDNADPHSFHHIADDYYADNGQVYFFNDIITNIDAKQYEYLGKGYLKVGYKLFKGNSELQGINIEQFRIIDENIIVDDKQIFYYTERIHSEKINFVNFTRATTDPYWSDFFTDKEHIYYLGVNNIIKLPELHPQSCEFLSSSYIKQNGDILYLNFDEQQLKFIKVQTDINTFEALPFEYKATFDAKDKNTKFLAGKSTVVE